MVDHFADYELFYCHRLNRTSIIYKHLRRLEYGNILYICTIEAVFIIYNVFLLFQAVYFEMTSKVVSIVGFRIFFATLQMQFWKTLF